MHVTLLRTETVAGALVVCLICSAASSGTLRYGVNNYYDAADAWMEDSASGDDDNYGGDPVLQIKYQSGGPDDCAIMRFGLTGQIPPDQRILSATLGVWYISAHDMNTNTALTLSAYRVTNSWFENDGIGRDNEGVNLMYRDKNQTLPWTNYLVRNDAVSDGNGTVRIKKTGGTAPNAIEPQHWAYWDVTSSVTKWYTGAEDNYGLLLLATGYEGLGNDGYGKFSSKEADLVQYRPELEITYEGALLPVADAGGPYNVDIGGSVLFDGSGSYDPDGGNITQWLWDLDGLPGYEESGQTVSKTFQYLYDLLGYGTHTIGLKVYDDENEWDTDTGELTIIPEPASMVLLLSGCLPAILRRRRRS